MRLSTTGVLRGSEEALKGNEKASKGITESITHFRGSLRYLGQATSMVQDGALDNSCYMTS